MWGASSPPEGLFWGVVREMVHFGLGETNSKAFSDFRRPGIFLRSSIPRVGEQFLESREETQTEHSSLFLCADQMLGMGWDVIWMLTSKASHPCLVP